MSNAQETRFRELFSVMMGLFKEIRCCSRDEALCRGVTFHQFVILDAAAEQPLLGLADLHGILGVEKSTTTRLVNPLLRRGLLLRKKAAHDSRAISLSLTEAGRQVHQEVRECLRDFLARIDAQLPGSQRPGILEAVWVFSQAIRQAADQCRCCRPTFRKVGSEP